ncbi:hypothetical protein EVAR_2918_1 [Eumeta japonica]|uniref:Uncharacterized protein n=1 Tax=Eumeta variegata TaxID=151549 RepID=A0A4C1T1W0_EUMVA|nr:hypothetical protein EVAR_2918_1 [Eumeta japonica]
MAQLSPEKSLLLEVMTEKMDIQTRTITENITSNILRKIEEEMKPLVEENEKLKNQVERLNKKTKISNEIVGTRQSSCEYVLGPFGYSERSRSGQKLVQFLMEHNLTVLNSKYKKKAKNKWTSICPDGKKDLILNGTKKENITAITEISKKMKESIRKDRKDKRLKTLEYHIRRTGEVKKALKELRKTGKQCIPNLKRKEEIITLRKKLVTTNFYRKLHEIQEPDKDQYSDTDTPPTAKAPLETVPESLPSEVEKATKSQKMEKSSRLDNIANELLKGTIKDITPNLTHIFNNILSIIVFLNNRLNHISF